MSLPAPRPSLALRLRNLAIQFVVLAGLLALALWAGSVFLQHLSVKARQAAAFQQWVAWRSRHCHYEGSLSQGVFVCDTGLRFQGFSGRYGEARIYPEFILKDPEKNAFVVHPAKPGTDVWN